RLPKITDAAAYELHFHDDVWQQAAASICTRHRLSYESLRRSPLGENIIFFVDERFVIKIFAPFRGQYEREAAALEFAHGKLCIETPEVVHTGEVEGWPYLVMTHLAGEPMKEIWPEIKEREGVEIVSRLGAGMRELHEHDAPLSQAALNRDWGKFIRRQASESVERQRACGANPQWLESLPSYIETRMKLLPVEHMPVLLHGDVHPGNVLLEERNGRWQVTGLFDFGDSFCGFSEYEFVAPGVLMVQGRVELQRAMLIAYGYKEAELDLNLRARLMLLTILYECSDLRKYALRLAPEAVHLNLEELEAAIWRFC
ncbi:MAG: aminoglycoside 3'-phosphotransferase/choline kinase family protein, partial [Pyrinomonadaceae bacterium]|nr:aminoglycoside 3'-phosphotransferase/choline kinase family protein [Pyrinomonadaceae bacterium]